MTYKKGLIIFIRNPELGKVKTRLAKSVGDLRALEIYTALLNYTRKIVQSTDCERFLFYADQITLNDNWSSVDFKKKVQVGNELGIRMSNAFQTLFDEGIEKAIIVGSDIAQLSSEIIEDAFLKLDHSDYVMGKALDGGYYLLGMKKPSPFLFQNIEWSTPNVAKETINKIISKKNSTVAFVDILSDIDYIEDWEKYGWDLSL